MANHIQLPTHTEPGGQILDVGPAVRVACFGDSLMWGQGLPHNLKYKTLFTQALGAHLKTSAGITYDRSRSGAEIIGSVAGRQEFVDTYPHLFPGGKGVADFTANDKTSEGAGRNESPASGLYGEIPSTYPTITAQVNLLSVTEGRKIDFALVDGGMNDINVEDVINPEMHDGSYIEAYDRAILDIGFTRVRDLLRRVRDKCPNSVILYFGFYPSLSYDSDTSKIRDFFKHEYNDDFKWWFNDHIYEVTDVDALINQGQNRGIWFHGRWTYWARQAVAAVNDEDPGGKPGVVYVPSGFTENNAAFAGQSFIWEDFTDPTTDPAQPIRLANLPRNARHTDMVSLVKKLLLSPSFGPEPTAEAAALLKKISGPLKLMAALRDYAGDHSGGRVPLIVELSAEIHRIQHGRIASLAHASVPGALRWAGLGMERFTRHREVLDRIAKEAVAPAPLPGVATVDAQLRRYKLRTSRSLAADAAHLEVDSLTLRVITAADSERNLAEPFFLVVHTKNPQGFTATHSYLLTFRPYMKDALFKLGVPKIKPYPYFEPSVTNRLTVATDGDLYLTNIVGTALVLGANPYTGTKVSRKNYGLIWRPQQVALEVNGREVVKLIPFGQKFGPGEQLDLGWPGPAGIKTPVVALPIQVMVKPFPKTTMKEMAKRANVQRARTAPSPP